MVRVLVPAILAASLAAGGVSRERQAEFLRHAQIVDHHAVSKGVTNTWRLTLTDGDLTHDASFQYVDERAPRKKVRDGKVELDFVDSYRYNIAAYRLAELLGLGYMVPVSVERSFRGRTGALTWWVDDVAMDETEKKKRGLSAPDEKLWAEQIYRVRVFSELIHDTDRNQGNLLITSDWKIWMIDFTRAFRRWAALRHPEWLYRGDRKLLAALSGLARNTLDETLSDILTPVELNGLWSRRKLILEHYEKLIQERGEAHVLY